MERNHLYPYFEQQLGIAIENLVHIDVDADTEHLHKLRTSLRRLRSLLKLFLPDYYVFSDALKELFSKTNELRELDVFLASIDASQYPILNKEIAKYRKKRYSKIWTKTFQTYFEAKLIFLRDEMATLSLPLQESTLLSMLQNHYDETYQRFEALEKKHSNARMHKLRIAFKNLRYGLEFINALGWQDETENIRQCKSIQDHLGLIQDASNQLDWLENFCRHHPCKECKQVIVERKSELKRLKKTIANSSFSQSLPQ